jgi:uncharacterized protein (DUF427 family)
MAQPQPQPPAPGHAQSATHPEFAAHTDDVAPVPRRIRAMLGGRTVLDTTRARYVWEWSHYPQYYIPLDDVDPSVLVDEGTDRRGRRGRIRVHGLRVGDLHRPGSAQVVVESPLDGVSRTVRFDWAALDHWYEEDEEVFVHPRDPYVRVDAIRSSRAVQVLLGDTVLAESTSPVLVFETGLPTRYYLPPSDLRYEHLHRSSETETACPYKGTTSYYLSATVDGTVHEDVAWCYSFPTAALLPIAGLVAFYQDKVDVHVDGQKV